MVRNPLLGLPVSDIDVCSSMRPEDVQRMCQSSGVKVIPKGIEYGTVQIMICDPDLGVIGIEHTTFRGDTYREGGTHKPSRVEFANTPKEDAFRRDFTVNALYLDLSTGEITDPTGGLFDIQNKLIRATSKDPREIMRSDGLRILRMIRFAAELRFTVEETTLLAAKESIEGLRDISFERIRDELNKILLSDTRYYGDGTGDPGSVKKALTALDSAGAFDIILPELAKGRGVHQDPHFHAYDVFGHALCACSFAPPRLELRLAALLHDIGKPYAIEINRSRTGEACGRGKGPSPMLGHDVLGEEIAREVLTRLRYPNKTIDEVSFLVLRHMYDLDGKAKESTLRARFALFGAGLSESLSYIREADVHGSGLWTGPVRSAVRWRNILSQMKEQNAPFSPDQLLCDGSDIMRWMGIGPSPRVGDIKEKLLEHCARFPKDNTPERLERITRGMR
jgi:tRNA nucleotidyltransferase (CCA-adding enzyme)